MQRLLGALLIIVGCAILIVDVPSIDEVVLSVSTSHGVHLSDVIGGSAIVGGIAALWRAPPR